MNLFKNLIRKKRIKKLATYKSNIEYYKNIADAEKNTIDNFQKSLDDLSTNPRWIGGGYREEYIKKIYEHRTQLSYALSEIEYWQTIYNASYNELYPVPYILEK